MTTKVYYWLECDGCQAASPYAQNLDTPHRASQYARNIGWTVAVADIARDDEHYCSACAAEITQ